jgi:NADH dehydrogenase/NADH:ubiquinone oxidoreductase subunit G
MLGRGKYSEISTYILNNINDPLSGNVIDLCPVGALTANFYSFSFRA